MDIQQKVLQYEFFGLGPTSMNVCTSAKLVVRVYDSDGEVAKLVDEINSLEQEREDFISKIGSPRWSPLVAWYYRWQISTFSERISVLHKQVSAYAVRYIDSASFLEHRRVGMETLGHSFKDAPREDLRELANIIETAKNFWLFVFKPNDLLASENQILAHVM